MSQHPSLRSSEKDKKARSVLKRYERIGIMKGKEEWADKDSIYGLPKMKIVKFKIKKEKGGPAPEAGAEGAAAAPGAGTAPATPAKDAGKAPAPEKKK